VRLKKLIIIGFKSFADKTVLTFDKGITCIVGPNGCGKSNISDAFRWVLGEQSAKSLRGHKMPDVIFAGTTDRKPLNFAEVSLTLTDLNGALPIDYEELTLTRRLHRSGESEYLINGNLVRLKDVQSLFLDSGVGRNAFSIFEQGKLDQVISYSPNERRYIFEEAAGILRFLQRKREALKRLELADGNFTRVKDIFQEVEKQIHLLEVQAEKALQFKQHKNRLETFEKTLFLHRLSGADTKKEALHDKKAQLDAVLQEKGQETEAGRQTLSAIKQDIQENEKNVKAGQAALYQLKNEKQMISHEVETALKKGEELKRRESRLKLEREDLKAFELTRAVELKKIVQAETELALEFSSMELSINDQLQLVKAKEKDVIALKQSAQIRQQAHLKGVQEESQALSELKQAEIRLENLALGIKQLEARRVQIDQEIEAATLARNDRKKQLQQVSGLVDSHKERLDNYEEEIQRHASQVESSQKSIEISKKTWMELKAREKILLKMREDQEGFSNGTKKILAESKKTTSPFFGKIRPLYEFLKPQPEAAEAVAIVLKSYGQTLVIENKSLFNELFHYAEREALQDYSLLCLEEVSSEGFKAGSLAEKMDVNAVSSHFLHRTLCNARLDETFHCIGKEWNEALTQNGGFVDSKKVYFNMKPGENQVFIRESELKNIENQAGGLEVQLQREEHAFQLLLQSKKQMELERAEVDNALRRDEMKLVEINFSLQKALADLQKLLNELVELNQKIETADQHRGELASRLSELKDAHASSILDSIRLAAEHENTRLLLAREEETLNASLQEHQEKGALFRTLSARKQELHHQTQLLKVQAGEHETRIARLEEEIEEGRALMEEVKKKGELQANALLEIELRLDECQQSFLILENEQKKLKEAKEQLEGTVYRQEELLRKKEVELTQINIAVAQLEASMEALKTELRERYDLEVAQLEGLGLPADLPTEQLEKSIRSLKQSIQAAGDINLASIEDLETQRVRGDFLGRQLEDMQQSKDELLQIIAQLDGESRKLFRETFEAIRTNFKKNYSILFSGGEADLQFTETDDILEAGIEITAKPPGKQMRSISLLSGGEKCLTAVALLFAIFEVKPAPFCILDEIDAPLDDSNVERFVNVVKHFADRCQFLIITHNKRTMAIGDILFGVSMEEKGISKLLSLEFNHQTPQLALI